MSALFAALLLIGIIGGVESVTCTGCKCCAQPLITKTLTGNGAHAFFSDTTDTTTGACAVRKLVCKGPMANIEINNKNGVVGDTIEVTCNAAGTAWTYAGTVITKLECASF
ncbi:hypothetical protein PRIPAC_89075 [Pristionchus pacificus]|uniref:C6 domain-containing protein n=1 Tax=Pristionchus pacificus TaxID=54126 RepID=A0A2A6B7P5_PRIPA|nr:hypothetical protein PRIPAC_89075 [Pristionchus pacificus]|eukprot:PDM61895.1 hypothetical protein PRIPAC_51337 [Pristionchus pacificus]